MANGPSINKLVEQITDATGRVVSSSIKAIPKAIQRFVRKSKHATYQQPKEKGTKRTGTRKTKGRTRYKK